MDTDPNPRPAPPPSSTPPSSSPGRRRLALPVAGATLTLVVAGGGIGYAASRYAAGGGTSAGTSTGTPPGLTRSSGGTGSSTRWQPPTPGGQGYGGYAGSSGSGTGPSGSTGSSDAGGSTGSAGAADTTSRASGSQLTGLVRIVSTMKYAGAKAAGTGMVLTSGGEVVTNHHVVEGATSIRVTDVASGTAYTATVVGTDASADVAVLQLSGASGLDTVTTDTDGIDVGEAVTAVGDGDGASYLSAANGTVLAESRTITTQSEGTASGERLSGLLQISSDVVPGYSGGATYDADGEVVGMTTAASSGGDIDGYAVPIATVLRIADDLESGASDAAYSYGNPAFLGIGLADSSTTVGQVYDGTPAAGAGISAGDSITRIDGVRVGSATALQKAIAAHDPGDSITVTWTSAGASHTATVTLASGPIA